MMATEPAAKSEPELYQGEKIERSESPNVLEIVTTSTQIRTLDQLLAVCEVDLKVWKVAEFYDLNTWGVTMKGPDGEPRSANNFQVKAKLVKRKPEAVVPVIQPIKTVRSRRPKDAGRVIRDVKTALILPDPQFGFARNMRGGQLDPFHDRRALDIALQVCDLVQPDVVVWLGDVLDLPTFSNKFLARPEYYWTVQSAVIEAHWWLSQFRTSAPAADIYMLEGNHDKRLADSVMDRFAIAYELRTADALHRPPALSIPGLLALDSLNIEYVGPYPDGRVWLNDRLACEHGAKATGRSGATAASVVRDTDVSLIFGHIHRRESAARTIHGRRGQWAVEALCPGCLCRVTGQVPGRQQKQNWQQGFAVVRYTDRLHTTPITVSVDQGKAIFEGTVFKGKEQTRRMAKDTGWDAFVRGVKNPR